MKKCFVFLAVFTSLTGTCFAQEKSMAKMEKQVKSKQTKVLPAPVAEAMQVPKKQPVIRFSMGMLESGRIDLKYTGLTAAKIIAAVEKRLMFKKGKFESTTDYNVRKSAALTAKFIDGSSVDDIFAFVVPVHESGLYDKGLSYKFNADTGDVNLYALPFSSEYLSRNNPGYEFHRSESKGLDHFTLSTKIESKSTYLGTNAYGATVRVEKTSMSETGIAANRIPFLKFRRDMSYSDPKFTSQFKLVKSRAAAELPVLKSLIVMKLTDPYVVYHNDYKEPKIDSPTETSMREKYLTGDVLGIVFYSGRTGEIFARLPETFRNPNVGEVPEDKLTTDFEWKLESPRRGR